MIIIIIIIEKSGSATITTHSQPPIPRGREKGQKSIRAKYFFFFFQHIKMSKAFTLEKSQKKCFLFMACTPVYFIVYGTWEPVYSLFRTPTLPYRAQPLLYATGKMSLNWGLDCNSICCMHAPVANCLPSFGRAIG